MPVKPTPPGSEHASEKPGGSGLPTSLIRNTLAQLSPVLVGYFFSFVAAPIVVAGLGIRAFGIWALTGALAQYGGLLDLGVGRSLARYVAAHQHDRRGCGEYTVLGFLTVAVVGALLLALAFATAPWLAHALGGITVHDMRIVLLSSTVMFVGSMLTFVIAAYPVGLRRMVAPNIGITIGALANFTASVGAIVAGAGLTGYAVANALASLVTVPIVAAIVFSVEGCPPLARPRHGRAKEFLSFSIKTQLGWGMELVNYQSDKIVIALSVGPAAAGSYELANRVAAAVRQIGVFPMTALLPTLTASHRERGLEHLRSVYRRLTEIVVSVSFPLVWLVAASAPLLLGAWLGHVPARAEAILPALCLAYLGTISSGVASVVASAAGDPGPVAKASVITAVANIAITATLAPIFGLWGVLAGTVVALSCGALFQVEMVKRRFSLRSGEHARAVLPTLRLCFVLAAPVFVVSYSDLIDGRLAQAVALVLMSAAYLTVYVVISTRAGRVPARIVSAVPPLRRLQPAQ
jgi:O-antigen/teichoic acid export membrane protein